MIGGQLTKPVIRQQQKTKPCGQERPAWDVAGRVNDLINCYLQSLHDYLTINLPLAVIAILLMLVMYIAAREFIGGGK